MRSGPSQHLMNALLVTTFLWQKSIQKFSLLQFYSSSLQLRDSLQIGFLSPVILDNFAFLGKVKVCIMMTDYVQFRHTMTFLILRSAFLITIKTMIEKMSYHI